MSPAALATSVRRVWQRGLRRLGPVGMAGAALIAAALALAPVALTLERSAESTHDAVVHQRSLAAHRTAAGAAAAPAPATAAQSNDQFIQGFPLFDQNANDLRALFEGAAQAHISLPQGDYALHGEAGSPFVVFTASFPLHEPYEGLKGFVANVLGALPHASLDEMRMARPDASGQSLDSTIRITLVYRRV